MCRSLTGGWCGWCLTQRLPQDERQDATMLVVVDLDGRVDAHADQGCLGRSVPAVNDERRVLARAELSLQADDVVRFAAVEVKRLGARSLFELQWEHTHTDEVRAMDPLETLRDHGAHAEETGAFSRPVARPTRPVLPPGHAPPRRAVLLLLHAPAVPPHLPPPSP